MTTATDAQIEEVTTKAPVNYQERTARASQIMTNYMVGSVVMGAVPIPLLDLAGLSAIQLKMLHSLASLYDLKFSAELARSAISSLLASVAPIYAAVPVALSVAKFIPVVGQGLSAATLPVFSGAATYAIGKVFIQHFESGGTFLSFDPEKMREHFKTQFAEGQNIAENVKKENNA